MLNVQFSDSTESIIVAYFASPQSASDYANLGTVETSDARWATFYDVVGGATLWLPAPTERSTG
jgi:hypothetical protein